MSTDDKQSSLRRRLNRPLKQLNLYEDNAGGLYWRAEGQDLVVAGMEHSEPGAALHDARLWNDWAGDEAEGRYRDADMLWGHVVLAASYSPQTDDLRVWPDDCGEAARRYLGIDGGT